MRKHMWLSAMVVPLSRIGTSKLRCAVTVLLLLLACCVGASETPSTTLNALVAFRKAITADPTGALSTWSINSSYCSWEGVACHMGTHQVKSIQLAQRRLQGSITPLLGQLSSLSYLNLSFNRLTGLLPAELGGCTSLAELAINDNQLIGGSLPREFANLTRLKVLSAGGNNLTGELPPLPLPLLHHLNLSTNNLQGQLNAQLAACATLRVLDLSSNHFQGSIPASWGNLSHLAYLELAVNELSSGLPPSLANCTHLYHINLFQNQLSGSIPLSWFPQLRHRLTFFSLLNNNGFNGSVPSTIASATKLEYIALGGNHFSGQLLHNLLNCTSLSVINLWGNSFRESLPADIGTALPHLTSLVLIGNSFYGNIPVSLSNCTELGDMIMGFNYGITGTIPKELFRLYKVTLLDLQYNALTGNIPAEIGNRSSALFKLLLNNNKFTGSLPTQLGLLPALQQLNFEYNQFSGGIPRELSNCTQLFLIVGYRNLLQGPLPSTFGDLAKLEHLILDNNQLSGTLPSSLSNCTRLTNISLNNNLLEGRVLAATLPNMLYFDLSNNRLSGSIPDQLGSMTQVQLMDLSVNNLSGSIPTSLASCANLFYLNLSSNHLSGSIPSKLAASLRSLIMLNLSQNALSGSIPVEIGNLTFLHKLDLSFNSLSGSIPDSLTTLSSLSFLNVSYNNLEGEVPSTGPFYSFSQASFIGNPGLCGLEILHITCPQHHSSKNSNVLLISLIVAGSVVLIVVLVLLCLSFSPTAKHILLSTMCSCCNSFDEGAVVKPAFLRLTMKEIQEATNNFSRDNVLGEGGTGVVYKGVIRDGKTVAFKKLHIPRSSSVNPFLAELRSMGQVRHKNLVKILGYFSDLENDILFLEYMPNGNLSQALHSENLASIEGKSTTTESLAADSDVLEMFEHDHALSWSDRAQLAKGIAAGLAYLHHDCPAPIIHLDIKPTNILLDKDLQACITDFGLSRIMQETATSMSTRNMRGSLGYVAPEYANMGKISLKCDVYSFGIVLLELLTGRSPTDEMFTQGKTLVSWVLSFKVDDRQFQDYLVELCMGADLENGLWHTSKRASDATFGHGNVVYKRGSQGETHHAKSGGTFEWHGLRSALIVGITKGLPEICFLMNSVLVLCPLPLCRNSASPAF